MPLKPCGCRRRHPRHRPRLLKQMSRPRHHHQLSLARQLPKRLVVGVQHPRILPAHHEQGWGRYLGGRRTRKVRSATPAHHRANGRVPLRRRHQRRRCPRARTKDTRWQRIGPRSLPRPSGRPQQASGDHRNVQAPFAGSLLLQRVPGHPQVHPQRPQPRRVQRLRHKSISWAPSPRSAPMGKHHQAAGTRRHMQKGGKPDAATWNDRLLAQVPGIAAWRGRASPSTGLHDVPIGRSACAR